MTNKVRYDYIAEKIGKSTNYVSCWISVRPSLNVKIEKQQIGKTRFTIMDKDEADRVIEMILSKKYKQEYDSHDGMPSKLKEEKEAKKKSGKKTSKKENDFSDPDWWIV